MGEISIEAMKVVSFLLQFVGKAAVGDPGFPTPIRTLEDGEFEIEHESSPRRSEGEISLD